MIGVLERGGMTVKKQTGSASLNNSCGSIHISRQMFKSAKLGDRDLKERKLIEIIRL